MAKTKEEYIELINNSAIFSYDKDSNSSKYAIEERKFMSLVVEHLYSINQGLYSNYGLEIVKVIKSCLKSYNLADGKFLHYFNVSLKKTIFKAKAKQETEKLRRGINIGTHNEILIRKILKLAKSNGKDVSDIGFLKNAASFLGVDIEEIAQVLQSNKNAIVSNSVKSLQDGQKVDFFDMLSTGEDVQKSFESDEKMKEILLAMDTVYQTLQERIKNKVRDILTTDILLAEIADSLDNEFIKALSFINLMFLKLYNQENKIYTYKEIAKMHNVVEQDISRARKSFYDKLKNFLYNG